MFRLALSQRLLSRMCGSSSTATRRSSRIPSSSSYRSMSSSPAASLDDDHDSAAISPQVSHSPLYMWGKNTGGCLPLQSNKELQDVKIVTVPTAIENLDSVFSSSKLSRVICGATDTAWILENGECYVAGQNKQGQLGLGHKLAVHQPTRLSLEASLTHKIQDVALGNNFAAIVDSVGELYTCGFGGSSFAGMGFLGLGDSESYTEFQLVSSLIEDNVFVKQVQVGEAHMTVLTTEGEVLTTGAGSYGRLGNFDTQDELFLTPLEFLSSGVAALAGGKSFTLALTDDGVIYGWGRNHKGQLGTGLGLAVDMYAMQAIPEPIESDELLGRKVVQIAAGQGHAACITEGGELFIWGMQLHLEPQRVNELLHTQIVQVACGSDYTLAVDKDGYMYSLGKGKNGCLGQGGSVKKANQAVLMEALKDVRVKQVSAGWDHAACLVERRD